MSTPSPLEAIFFAALEKGSPNERVAYLDEACAGDRDLQARVEKMLTAQAGAGSFLEMPAGGSTTTSDEIPLERPGNQIGPYKLLQQIGEGGMGVVFLAEQHEPVQRKVALKVIKPGMDTRQVIARFDAERQALSLMDHPNIAKVLDAGTTDYGRPYFVMELVKGQPITNYCDEHQLTPRQRLELFVSACHAIQHAHQKGIIHRDVKPSNVLVAEYDDRPVCKVIDFGVAKALHQPLTEKSMFTGVGQILGTLEYMSPEQAKVNQLDIDTRSDVYSLGVLLYELLTGTTPFNKQRLGSAAWDEMLRIIREEEPPMPSTRLSELGRSGEPSRTSSSKGQEPARLAGSTSSLASVAAQRHIEPAKLTKLVRGELDWIVMKALEKDRGRRYETANGFAMDIQRYLSDEPVQACPPSKLYRFRKFTRKHKAVVAIAVGALFILLLGCGGLAVSNSLIRAEQSKTKAFAEELKSRADELKAKADELKLVSDFQAEMLEYVDPTETGKLLTADVQVKFEAALTKAGVPEAERTQRLGVFTAEWKNVNATDAARELIDRTILRPAVAAIDKQFADQPLIDAQLRQVLADRYQDLGLYDAALPLQLQALATRRKLFGNDNVETLTSANAYCGLLLKSGKLDELEPIAAETLATCLVSLGETHALTIEALQITGCVFVAQGKHDESAPFVYRSLEFARKFLGEDHRITLDAITNVGTLLLWQRRFLEAEKYLREALEKQRRILGDDHATTLATNHNLGCCLREQGKFAEAEVVFRDQYERSCRVLGEYHPETLSEIHELAILLLVQGRLSEADALFREAWARRSASLGPDNMETLNSLGFVAYALLLQQNFSDAEAHYRMLLETAPLTMNSRQDETLKALCNLGVVLQASGKSTESEPYLRDAIQKMRGVMSGDDPRIMGAMATLGASLTDQRKFDEAEQVLGEVLAKSGDKTDWTEQIKQKIKLAATIGLGTLRQAQRKSKDALELLEPCGEWVRTSSPSPHSWFVGRFLVTLGSARLGVCEFAAAETDLLEAYALFLKSPGESQRDLSACAQAIVELYTTWDAAEPEQGFEAKAAEWQSKLDALAQPPAGSQPDPN